MYLGIEIGGTKLQIGVGDGEGHLAGLWRGTVNPSKGAEGIRQRILEGIPILLRQANLERDTLRGVGIGFGGPVDDARQAVIKSHQIEGWDNFPLAQWIGDMLGLPARLGNDADVAGLAEARFGAGKGLSPVFYVTIGSGIGGGLILGGEIYRGVGKGAAEIGHLRIPTNDHETEILEHLVSGWGIGRRLRACIARSPEAPEYEPLLRIAGGNVETVNANHLAIAAGAGDPFALRFLSETWPYLAEALCHVIALLCPARIVIGGGVSLMGEELLFCPLRRFVAQRVFVPFADCYEIVPAALGEEVVVHGALAIANRRE